MNNPLVRGLLSASCFCLALGSLIQMQGLYQNYIHHKQNQKILSHLKNQAQGHQVPMEWEGTFYAGILSLPFADISIPVGASWSLGDETAGVFEGSLYSGNLILAGDNSSGQFGFMHSIKVGEIIQFIDSYFQLHTFEVVKKEEIKTLDMDQLLFQDTEDWQISLFTSTLGSRSCLVARLREIQNS